jgi:hypothetical protein
MSDAPKPVLYRYQLQTADEAGEKRHPQIVIREHFPDAHDLEPHSIGDCWLFKAAKRKAPAFFVEVEPTPPGDYSFRDVVVAMGPAAVVPGITVIDYAPTAKPADPHPAPWHWEDEHEGGFPGQFTFVRAVLRDASGVVILPAFASVDGIPPDIRALTEAAKELRNALEKVTANLRNEIEDETPASDVEEALAEAGVLEAESLLERLRKAGA